MTFQARSILAGAVAVGIAVTAPAGAAGADGTPTALNCEALKNATVAHTTISMAETVAAGAFKAAPPGFGPPVDYSKLPAFCRVTGSIHPTADSDIRFELWLPSAGWNGKFLQAGNGGAAGSIVYGSMADPLSRGYAVANTDTGHQGSMGDFSWVAGHPERMTDYTYRAVHELTVTGKAITSAGYGRSPAKSYWLGCSTGGRQGLKEAQRYPDDYDAIVAGAPANNWSPLMSLSIVISRELTSPTGLPVNKLPALHEAALARCDSADGLQDRIISEPGKCVFDPSSLKCQGNATQQCLSPAESAAAQRIYAGVVNKAGRILIPGTGPGSELEWAAYGSPQFSIGTSYFRYVVAQDLNWDPRTFAVDTDVPRMEKVDQGAADAMNPDLSRFMARGGKLILYHGTTDGLIPSGNSVNYYESVVARLGKDRVRAGIRFYLVPGMNHCYGGEGPFMVDWLGAMEKWVAKGEAPDALHGEHPALVPTSPGAPPAPSKPYSRPVCAYPSVAKYKGSGDRAVAASFSCVAP